MKKMSYLDKAVGLPINRKNEQISFEQYLDKHIDQVGGEKIENLELEKNNRDIEIINFVKKSAWEYMEQYNRQKNIDKPISNIHLLKEGGVEEYTEGESADGACSSTIGEIIIDRVKLDTEFATKLFHELLHSNSYQALQETLDHKKIDSYRSGVSVTSRDGTKKYFIDFEEAVISILTTKFLNEKVKNSQIFNEEDKAQNIEISRQEEVNNLNNLVDDLWIKNQNEFKNKEEILNLFIDAQLNGRLLKIGKLIEHTYGKGSFKKLGTSKK